MKNLPTSVSAVLVLGLATSHSIGETIFQGTKLSFSGVTSTEMFSNLDFSAQGGLTEIRGANFSGLDQMVGGVNFSGTSGINGISWTGLPAGLHFNTPNAGDAGLNVVLSTGIHGPSTPPSIDVTAVPGNYYRVQLLVFSDFNSRQFDIYVDGIQFADEFESFFTIGNPTHSIYSFDVVADGDGIDIDLAPGSVPDTNPFVQGLMVSPLAMYNCVGFEPPMAGGPVKVKGKRALPLKMYLFDNEGDLVTDEIADSPPIIHVQFDPQGAGDPSDVTSDVLAVGQGTLGNQFELNEDGKWQFNLKTNNFTASGTYSISVIPGDSYMFDSNCEASFVVK